MFSKPKYALGVSGVKGIRTLTYFVEPPIDSCPVCRDDLRYNEFLELSCSHTLCKGCALKFAVAQLVRGRPFTCPECRSTASHLECETMITVPLPGIPTIGKHVFYAVVDTWSNWHVHCVQCAETGACFVHHQLTAASTPRLRSFTRAQTIHISPYSGWLVPNGDPNKNPRFLVRLESATLVGAVERERVRGLRSQRR